ncbi:MAG: hypothetical protein J0M00_24300 [Burkholderiales bacterium]|nr:hypothetical protein [Burkholderiales bacterium]
MSDYPRLRVLRTSTAERQGGQEPARATNGAMKLRRLYATEKTDFVVVHALNRDERDALEAFYQANRDAAVDLWWPEDAAVYSVVFTAPPQYLRRGDLWEAQVRLSEV